MGISQCACKRNESEEEIITRIFKTMNLSEMNVNDVYKDFMNCIENNTTPSDKSQDSPTSNFNINTNSITKPLTLDKTLYENFICKLVNPILFREAQADYFENLIEINDLNINGIKRIGTILIFLADGDFMDKINLLEKHIEKFYGKLDMHFRDFISDLIDLNTDMCLLSFKNVIDAESMQLLSQIWKKPRKQKLIKRLLQIYEEMKESVSKEKEWNVHVNKFLISSYNNLTGESIRANLYEQHLAESNKLIMSKK